MSGGELVGAAAVGLMLGLCGLVAICLRGTAPPQRPEILRALAELVASLWPTRPTNPGKAIRARVTDSRRPPE